MKTIEEQIEIIIAYKEGKNIEFIDRFTGEKEYKNLNICKDIQFNFRDYDYRIKEQKQTVTIEKWLMKAGNEKSYFISEGDKSMFENYFTENKKVKLLETFEIEL